MKTSMRRPEYAIGQKVYAMEKNPEWDTSVIIDIKYYETMKRWAYKIETKFNHLDPEDAWFWGKQLSIRKPLRPD